MPILALLPAILGLTTAIVGPLLESHKNSIISQILGGGFDGTVGSIINIIESVIGKMDDLKRAELQAQVATLLAQAELNKIDAQSDHFIQWAWRPLLAWGLGVNIVLHYTVVNIIDILNGLLRLNLHQIAPMDPMALTLMTGLLGIYMAARSFDKKNGV